MHPPRQARRGALAQAVRRRALAEQRAAAAPPDARSAGALCRARPGCGRAPDGCTGVWWSALRGAQVAAVDAERGGGSGNRRLATPIFPLPTVAFPTAPVPLHIFEARCARREGTARGHRPPRRR